MKNFDLILFDWDGTIAITLDYWVEAIKDTIEMHGLDFSEEDVIKLWNQKLNLEQFNELTDESRKNVFKELVIKAHDLIPRIIKYYPNFDVTLRQLKEAGFKLGIVTNSDLNFIESNLIESGLIDLFDTVVTADDVDNLKPDPQGINMALKATNSLRERTLYIGDMITDIQAAKAAGVKIAFYRPKENEKYILDGFKEALDIDYTFKDYTELKYIVM